MTFLFSTGTTARLTFWRLETLAWRYTTGCKAFSLFGHFDTTASHRFYNAIDILSTLVS